MPGGTGTTGRRIVDRLKARGLPVDGDGWTGLVLGDALVAMALVTGLNYTCSVAVMPNLGGADDRTFVELCSDATRTRRSPQLHRGAGGDRARCRPTATP